ncbi:MAG TPA: ribosome-associated translation inhibitor RaiA [Sphingomonadaceae bacterium]|jgi:ribosomal subunit interface protein|nr:ribosome-associated translation inhibitor RaiA [Sphingomonadaceae bacterium]
MEIRVSGHRVDTGDALRAHVEKRMRGLADKYFSRSIAAQVTFGRGPRDNAFSCDIVVHVMQGLILKGSGQAMEAHPAFDLAADRIEKQLRRYMRRLKNRAVGTGAVELDSIHANAGYTVFQASDDDGLETADNPPIIAETRVDVPEASVSDAVMMLDLRNTTALLFRNSGTGTYNMVYRRGDGTIGWVEPQRAA